jgi:unconventional prefoldin RPB5 interactor 1
MQQPTRTLPTAIEAHRFRLEESFAKLCKALDSGRIYSFEYEAFREELQALPAGASPEAMVSSHYTRYALFYAVRQGA